MADWQKIKTEYITTDTSYRKLAQKFGVNVTNIAKRASQEKWVEERKRIAYETQSKILATISAQQANRTARLQNVADKLLTRVETLLDEEKTPRLDSQSMKHISGVLKDIKEIQMIRSENDLREQEARIANLQRQAQTGDDSKEPIQIMMGEDLADYCG